MGAQYNVITGNGLKGPSASFLSRPASKNPDNQPAASCQVFNRGRYAHLLDLGIFLVEEQDHRRNPGQGSQQSAKQILKAFERGFEDSELAVESRPSMIMGALLSVIGRHRDFLTNLPGDGPGSHSCSHAHKHRTTHTH